MFIKCPMVPKIWKLADVSFWICWQQFPLVETLWNHIIQNSDQQKMELVANIIWSICKGRNANHFEKKPFNPKKVISQVQNIMRPLEPFDP